MKKLLFISFILLNSNLLNAQLTTDTIWVKDPLQVVKTILRKDTIELKQSFISQVNKSTSDIVILNGQLNGLTNTVNSLNNIVTTQGNSITSLQGQVNALSEPLPKIISGSTYTVLSSDNRGVIAFTNTCTVNIPSSLPIGFSCVFYRIGSGAVSFTGTFTSPISYRRAVSLQPVWLNVLAANNVILTGNLTK